MIVIGIGALVVVAGLVATPFLLSAAQSKSTESGAKSKRQTERDELYSDYARHRNQILFLFGSAEMAVASNAFPEASNYVAKAGSEVEALSNTIYYSSYRYIRPPRETCPALGITLPANTEPTYHQVFLALHGRWQTEGKKVEAAAAKYWADFNAGLTTFSNQVVRQVRGGGNTSAAYAQGIHLIQNDMVYRESLLGLHTQLIALGAEALQKEVTRTALPPDADGRRRFYASNLAGLNASPFFGERIPSLRRLLVSNLLENTMASLAHREADAWALAAGLWHVHDTEVPDWGGQASEVKDCREVVAAAARRAETLHLSNLALQLPAADFLLSSNQVQGGYLAYLNSFRALRGVPDSASRQPLQAAARHLYSERQRLASEAAADDAELGRKREALAQAVIHVSNAEAAQSNATRDVFSDRTTHELRSILVGDVYTLFKAEITDDQRTPLGRKVFMQSAAYRDLVARAELMRDQLLASDLHWHGSQLSPFEISDYDLATSTFRLYRPKPFLNLDFGGLAPPALDSLCFAGQGRRPHTLTENGQSLTLNAIDSTLAFSVPEAKALEVERLKKAGRLEVHLYFRLTGLRQEPPRMNLQGATLSPREFSADTRNAFAATWRMFEEGEFAERVNLCLADHFRLELRNKETGAVAMRHAFPTSSPLRPPSPALAAKMAETEARRREALRSQARLQADIESILKRQANRQALGQQLEYLWQDFGPHLP